MRKPSFLFLVKHQKMFLLLLFWNALREKSISQYLLYILLFSKEFSLIIFFSKNNWRNLETIFYACFGQRGVRISFGKSRNINPIGRAVPPFLFSSDDCVQKIGFIIIIYFRVFSSPLRDIGLFEEKSLFENRVQASRNWFEGRHIGI